MPCWVSAIAAGRVATARRMSLAALSTASSIELACCRADSAARTQSTSSPCSPATGLATSSRARLIEWSAKSSRSLAASTLRATEASAVSANSLCSWVSVDWAGSMRALTSTNFWVSASSRSGALMTRSRSSWNAWVWASSSRSARAAATTTRVSRSRRWAGVSGIASSSCWRTLNACCRVALAFSTARLNRSACCWPNSSAAKANSLVLVRTALSTSTTIDRDNSSRASRGTAASALGSVGSTRLAAATSASCRLCRRRRLHSTSSTIASQDDRDDDQQRNQRESAGTAAAGAQPRQPVGGRDRRACPVAVVQRRLDLVHAGCCRPGWRWHRQRPPTAPGRHTSAARSRPPGSRPGSPDR